MTPSSASVRASVERGDPLAIGVAASVNRRYVMSRPDPRFVAALADRPKPDPPEAVAADPQTLDTQSDGDYLDRVHPAHPVDSDSPPHMAEVREAHRAGWSEQDRLAFLARVQRIDPRERRS